MLQSARQLLQRTGGPCFGLSGHNVTVLTAPSQLYEALLTGIASAEHRIAMSSLYFGTGTLEADLARALHDKKKSLGSNVDVHVLLDVTRGTRGRPSSVDMLRPLLQAGGRLSLFHTPQLRGLLAKLLKPPFNEVLGLQHTKLYVFDDITVLTGANLSADYFTHRQDRCVVIKDPGLADFCARLVGSISTMALDVVNDSSAQLKPASDMDPRLAPEDQCWKRLGEALKETLVGAGTHASLAPNSSGHIDTWVYPLLQMGRAGIDMDESTVPRLISETSGHVDLASGYFNLSDNYLRALLDGRASIRVLSASPKANGFLGAKGIQGHIPAAYTHIEHRFHQQVVHRGLEARIALTEFERSGWTFHAKGVWLRPKPNELPYATLIGSSNLGRRSAWRDVEAQFAFVTENRALQAALHSEVEGLWAHAVPVNERTFAEKQRIVKTWEQIATHMISSFL